MQNIIFHRQITFQKKKKRKTHCSFITFHRLENHLKFQPSLFSITSHPFFFLLPRNFPPHSGKSKSLLEISPRKTVTHIRRARLKSQTLTESTTICHSCAGRDRHTVFFAREIVHKYNGNVLILCRMCVRPLMLPVPKEG